MINKIKLVAVLAIAGSFTAFAQPKLEIIGGNTYNWGSVKRADGPLKAKVKIKNAGTELLDISNVKPGCGCTTAPLDKNKLNPGEEATLDITLKIDKDSGPVTKGITITSNDPANGKVNLMIKADVYVALTVFPKMMNFSASAPGQEVSSKIVVTNKSDKPIKVTKVMADPNVVTLDLKVGQVIPAKADVPVTGTLKSSSIGPVNGKVTILTDSQEAPELVVRLRGSVVSADQMAVPQENQIADPATAAKAKPKFNAKKK